MVKLVAISFFIAAALGAQLETRETIPFFIEDGTGVPGYRDSDHELARMAIEAWSRESGGKLKFRESKDRAAAIVQLRWVSAQQGLFGQMQPLRVNGKAGAVVHVMPEVANLGEPLANRAQRDSLLRDTIVYLTCVHELGHAVGMPHTNKFADIMYSFGYGGDIVDYFMRYRNKLVSRSDFPKHSGLSAGDIEFLRGLYR